MAFDRRRLLLAASALLSAPLLHAQVQRRPARIGVLSSNTPEARSHFWDAFRQGMLKLGWVEDRDVTYFYRYTRGNPRRFDELAQELVAEKPDLLFAGTGAAALAAKRATRDVPIVFAFALDPVESGLVASLAKPGGNATGLTGNSLELRTKLLELLKEVRPRLRRVAVVVARTGLGQEVYGHTARAASAMGIELRAIEMDTAVDVVKAFDIVAQMKPDAVIWQAPVMLSRQNVAQHAADLQVPTIYSVSEVVEAGGLMSYGVDVADNYRRAAAYVDRILKGDKPADLPVEQPTKFDLVVNLKAARAQGIKIPQSILVRATRVIE
jgi:putative ABC transport system substrate-binding protein